MSVPESSLLSPSSRARKLYQYQPLDPKNNEIRLLKIHPDPQAVRCGEPVKCSLVTTSLNAPPTYQALSYTWGTAPNVEDILLDGRRLKITPNLEDALLQLRDDKVELIWIDAICINQADLSERSEQVSKMRSIYERAEEVLVWLGSSIGGAVLAFDLLEDLYRQRDSETSIRKILNDTDTVKGLRALLDLFRKDYWRRLWVVQEVNSAKKILLLTVQKMLPNHATLFAQLSMVEPTLDPLSSAAFDYGPKHLELSQEDAPLALPSPFSLLCKFWDQTTSDPRDKIYALVGLSSARDDPDFIIDYSLPTRLVYIDMAKYIFQRSQKLDIIYSLPRRNSSFGLPSWVPDWTIGKGRRGAPLVSILEAKGSTFGAAGTSTAKFSLKHSNQILIAAGIHLSRIQSFAEKENLESQVDIQAGIPILLSWYRLCHIFKTSTSTLVDAFSRAIYFDTLVAEDFIHNTLLEVMEMILAAIIILAEELCPGVEIDPQMAAFRTKYNISKWWAKSSVLEACAIIRRRRLFISNSNLIGLGPDTAEVGDIICILLGCSVPVILRPKDGHYIFLGEAYFHGYMYGKAMEELAEGKFQLESFEIH